MAKVRHWVPWALLLLLSVWWAWESQNIQPSVSTNEAGLQAEDPSSQGFANKERGRALGVAPPGRGRSINVESQNTQQNEGMDLEHQYPPPEPYMNGEMVAWIVNDQQTDLGSLVLVSADCGIRAAIREGQAFVLVPPGECEFQVVTTEPFERPVSDAQTVTISPGQTTSMEWVISSSIGAIDTGN